MERGQIINMNRSLEKVDPTLVDDFEGFKTWVEEITADVAERASELELQAEAEDVTELLRSHLAEGTRSCSLQMSKEHGFLKWGLLLGEMVKIAEMTAEHLECYLS